MDSQVEEIKNKLNVLDVVGNYVKLTKTGINYRGICPFHSEKGPSFFVSPARQMWHCFGCGAGGSIFDFVMRIEGIEFGDALKILAQKAGVELKRQDSKLQTERTRLYEICDLACSFFEKQLGSSAYGKEAESYLLKRGISSESIKKWRLGYSPDTWQGLSDFIVGRGYQREEILKAGLAVKSDKGGNPYDRFRGRIIFPIFDLSSQVIGFGARVFKDADKKETAKYINTPQTLIYDKSNILYGMNFAKLSVRKNNQCVLTEGYTDAIMCHQAGFENTVAVSGTALTSQHLNILKRYAENLLLAFDMDLAGDNATKRGINMAQSQGFNMRIIDTYSGAKDPAETILENPENWKKSLEKARTIMDFYFDSAFAKLSSSDEANLSPENKKQISKIILPAIKRLQNKIEQSHWAQKLADRLGVSQQAVLEELKDLKPEMGGVEVKAAFLYSAPKESFTAESRKKLLEERIFYLIFKNPINFSLISEADYCLFCEKNKKFLMDLKKLADPILSSENEDKEEKLRVAFASISLVDEDMAHFNKLALIAESDLEEGDPNELKLCLFQLKRLELKNELGRLSGSIKNHPDQEVEDRLREFNKKARELHQSN